MKVSTIEVNGYKSRISGEIKEKLEFFRNLLLEYNQKYNLTAITDEKEVMYKHFLDSISGESAFLPHSKVAEVGSGAGFPSIPLKIFRSDLKFTLMESTGKKCDFLSVVVDKLDLKEVEIKCVRAEDAGKSELRESFDAVTARAVARLNTLAEYCMPFIRVGGRMIAYKGNAMEEVVEAKRAFDVLGGKVTEIINYELPENMGSRGIVIAVKGERTPEKYPRGRGKERSMPIK